MIFTCPMCEQKLTAEDMVFKDSSKYGLETTTCTLKCNCGYVNISDGSGEKIETKEKRQEEFKRVIVNIQWHFTVNWTKHRVKFL